jgi:hypothetical protein
MMHEPKRNHNESENMKTKTKMTAKEIRVHFQTHPAAFISAIRALPATVGDYWEKVAETRDGKKVNRRVAYVSGPGLRDFVRALPQGQERETAAALSQTLATVASGLSVLETGVYRLTEGGGKFPWKVEGSHTLSFTPGMATPPAKPEVKEFPVNEAFAAIAAMEKEERERIAADAEAVRIAAREAAAEEVREAMEAVTHCEGIWKAYDAAFRESQERVNEAHGRTKGAKKGEAVDAWKAACDREAECKAKADEAWDNLRKAETSLARKRALAAAL